MRAWIIGVLVCVGGVMHAQEASRPGLVGAYTQYGERPNTSTTHRVDAVPAMRLEVGESPVHDRASISEITWLGTITVPTTGDYQFAFTARNANVSVSFKIAEKQKVELIGNAFEKEQIVTGDRATIPAGTYPIRIAIRYPYRKEPAFDVLKHPRLFALRWTGPGFREEPVPASIFRHDAKLEVSKNHGDLRTIERGQFLFRESQCFKCHQAPDFWRNVISTPDLSRIADRTNAGWLEAWLADPKAIRPHTNMPAMFADTPTGKAERYAVTQFLMTLGEATPAREAKTDTASIRRGERLFMRVGCAACHANTPGGETKTRRDDDDPAPAYDAKNAILGMGSPTGPQSTYALGAVGSKWNAEKLAEYLVNPAASHKNTRMPSMGLSKAEAKDLASYLMTMKDAKVPVLPAKPEIKPSDLKLAKPIDKAAAPAGDESKQWVLAGASLFESKGCINCHLLTQDIKKNLSLPLDRIVKNTKAGCLADSPSVEKTPVYSFSADDRNAIRAAMVTQSVFARTENFTAVETRYQLTRLMCLNCHERDGEGGLAATMVEKMKTLATADDADQIRPPTLTQIGHKATKTWLADVLLKGQRARPWQGLRMPQYGESNASTLVHGLPALDGVTDTVEKPATINTEMVSAGRLLTGKEGYGCIACHDISGIVGGGTRGPDLAMTMKRIRPEWFDRWMHNPQRVQPGTKMPQYFLNGQATHAALGANPEKQIAALKAYYDLGPGLPLPTGLEVPKGLVQVVGDRPVILRTFMPEGAGTRAITVGFPGGINIAYDPTQSRVAYLWTGPFLDMTPVWTGRGGQPAKLMGPIQWDHGSSASWTTIDPRTKSAKDEMSTKPLPSKFVKYTLDDKGVPTFHSEMDGITMSETIRPLSSPLAIGISRELTATVPDGRTIWFNPSGGTSLLIRNDGNVHLSRADGKAVILKPIASKFDPAAKGTVAFTKGTSTFKMEQWILPRDNKQLIEEFLK